MKNKYETNTKGDIKKAENANWLIHRPILGQGVVFLSMESFILYDFQKTEINTISNKI